jgi:tetratricopeptide (TPR) repeat protein
MTMMPCLLMAPYLLAATPVVVGGMGKGEGGDAAAAYLEAAISSNLKPKPQIRLLQKNTIWSPAQTRHFEGLELEAEKNREAGQIAFEDLEAELAIEAYHKAVESLLSQIDILDSKDVALKTAAEYAKVLHQVGEEDKARDVFRTILFIDPGFSSDVFPGLSDDDVALLHDEEMTLAFETSGSLMITQGADPVEVWVDGVMIGVTPMTLTSLAPGLHYYALRRDGYQRRSGRFRLTGGQTKKIQGQLVQLEAMSTYRQAAEKVSSNIDAAAVKNLKSAMGELIAQLPGVEEMVYFRLEVSEDQVAKVTAIRWDCHRGVLLAEIGLLTSLDKDGLDAAAEDLVASLYTEGVAVAAAPTPADQIESEEEPPGAIPSTWLWAGAGLAAGIGIGALAALSGGMATYVVVSAVPSSTEESQVEESSGEDPSVRYIVLGY